MINSSNDLRIWSLVYLEHKLHPVNGYKKLTVSRMPMEIAYRVLIKLSSFNNCLIASAILFTTVDLFSLTTFSKNHPAPMDPCVPYCSLTLKTTCKSETLG